MPLIPLLRRSVIALSFVVLPFSLVAQSIADQLLERGPYKDVGELIALTDGAEDALTSDRELTLFAPTNEAFSRLPQNLRDTLLQEGQHRARELLLGAHIVEGRHEQDDLPVEMESLGGERLVVTYTDGALTLRIAAEETTDEPATIRDARGGAAQIRATASDTLGSLIVHPIDRVLLPMGLEDTLEEGREAMQRTGPETTAQTPTLPQQIAQTDEDASANVVPVDANEQAGRTDPPGLDDLNPPDAEIIALTPQPVEQGSALAADEPRASQQSVEENVDDASPGVSLTRDVTSVSALIGQSVTSPQGEEMGQVSDFLMALETGQVETVIILQETGFLGLGETEERRIPLDNLSIDPLQNRLIADPAAEGGRQGSGE